MKARGVIAIESGVSAFTGEPFVQLRWGRESGQLDPAEARLHALAILEAAEAAESDALVVALLTEPEGIGMERQIAFGFLGALRERRQARWAR